MGEFIQSTIGYLKHSVAVHVSFANLAQLRDPNHEKHDVNVKHSDIYNKPAVL